MLLFAHTQVWGVRWVRESSAEKINQGATQFCNPATCSDCENMEMEKIDCASYLSAIFT